MSNDIIIIVLLTQYSMYVFNSILISINNKNLLTTMLFILAYFLDFLFTLSLLQPSAKYSFPVKNTHSL